MRKQSCKPTFLDFANVISYLISNLSAMKGGCIVSFKVQVPQTSLTLFWKMFARFYQENEKFVLLKCYILTMAE